MVGSEPEICEVGGGGLFLPFNDDEQRWPDAVRAFLYLVILGWFFLGVAIIADIFMAAIEAVTSKRKAYRLKSGQTVYVRVWNATVANLTLMALGSSAPEILLNVIEILSKKFYAGDLGPSTIVGSAAFNLMVIIAVCVYVIPSGEARTLRQPDVFKVTAFFSVFAYIWLIFILAVVSPDLVEAWEGVVTFCFFPVLVVTAFLVDIGMCSKRKQEVNIEEQQLLQAQMMERGMEITEEDALMMLRARDEELVGKSKAAVRAENGLTAAKGIASSDLSVGFVTQRFCFHEADTRLELEVEKNGDLAMESRVGIEYRTSDGTMTATRGQYHTLIDYLDIPAGQKSGVAVIERMPEMEIKTSTTSERLKDVNAIGKAEDEKNPLAATNGFDEYLQAQEDFFNVEIIRAVKLSSNTNGPASCTASDRMSSWPARSGTCSASMNDPINVKDRQFMTLADELNSKESSAKVSVMPDYRKVQVAITSIEESGQLRFEQPELSIPGKGEIEELKISVQRLNGSAGELTCRYTTEADTAKPVGDYEHTEGELVFLPGVMSQEVVIKILPKPSWEGSDRFFVVLSDIPGRTQCVLEDFAICGVNITSDRAAGFTNNILRLMDNNMNLDAWQQGTREWKEQWFSAFRPNSASDDDQVQEATAGEWTLHIIALPWKVLFALVPPPAYCNGWLCFCVALAMIGLLTGFIGDLAGLLGCVLGLKPGVTAITIVAIGTSLPDTFASKVAAVEDPTADMAVGNVTGSNSVNVFLGLGLPWMIASIYWATNGKNSEWRAKYPEQDARYPNGGFVVVAGDLVYSVIVFSIAACTCLGVIWYRRVKFQAELGGPVGYKVYTSVLFVLFWFWYVGISSWKTNAGDVGMGAMIFALVIGIFAMAAGMVVIAAIITLHKYLNKEKHSETDRIIDAIQKQSGMASISPVVMSAGSLPEAVAQLQEHIAGLTVVARALESLATANQYSEPRSRAKSMRLRTSMRNSLKVGTSSLSPSSMTPKKPAGKKRSESKKVKKVPSDSGAAAAAAEVAAPAPSSPQAVE